MKLIRENWSFEYFSKEVLPNWICPTCNKGALRFPKGWVIRHREAATKKENEAYLSANPEMDKGVFHGRLECQNPACHEIIACVGKFHHDLIVGDAYQINTTKYYPEYFTPALHVFQVDESCPEEVTALIQKSFSLLFASPSSAGNLIRTAVERLIDQQIGKPTTDGYISLDKRINDFAKSNPALGEYLMSVKWIGNEGSHGRLIVEDVLDGYEFLIECIEQLYAAPKRIAKLNEKAQAIIAVKGKKAK